VTAPAQVCRPVRFAFGKNWARFLSHVDPDRLEAAEAALTRALGEHSLAGASFLDIGSGSGLLSLAARRLGATVRSFDYDCDSVQCTREVRDRFFPQDPTWTVERGDVLDPHYLDSLGELDVVYSWGVLHHTGDMWQSIENIVRCVRPGGKLFIAVYNDTGLSSRVWKVEKRLYARSPRVVQVTAAVAYTVLLEVLVAAARLSQGRNPISADRWRKRKRTRGMSMWHDNVDWLGGYPYEYAKPDEIFRFFVHRGFRLEFLTTTPHNGCNEYVLCGSISAR
jgi:2-polyprenyl-3-methyl-5-hydroxy-6-metoxy-1,4-benzoquinol methylase